jgi:hypothetical protein
MAVIVTTVHRPKRPARKRKPVAITGVKASRLPTLGQQKPEPAAPPPPANDDRKPPRPGARKPSIITTASRKRSKLERAAERAAEPDGDPEATVRVRAFLARMIRPGGALPPK